MMGAATVGVVVAVVDVVAVGRAVEVAVVVAVDVCGSAEVVGRTRQVENMPPVVAESIAPFKVAA